MNEQVQAHQPNLNPSFSSLPMIRTLALVAMLSGLLVVVADEVTRPVIAENQRQAVEQAIFQVIPQAIQWQEYRLNGETLFPITEGSEGIALYAGFNATGHFIGIATEAAAQGYADTISLLYGYNPNCECITGIKVLKSKETPGLGDKIYKDPSFTTNFKALDTKLNEEGSALKNTIITVKHGKKEKPWQIDAISGATVSSRAVGKALNDSAQYLLPKLVPQLSAINNLEAISNE